MSEPFDEQPDGDPHGECAAEIHRLEARITELEERLEIGTGPYDGIAARDETIRLLEAENARLRVDAERLSQYFSDEEDTYSAVGDYLDNAQPDIGDTFELTKCYAERKPTRFRVISRGLDITGEPIIDVEEVDEAKSHSANTVGGPTPVMDAAPACERKE